MGRVGVILLLCIAAMSYASDAFSATEVLQFEGVAPPGGEFVIQDEATFQEGSFSITAFTSHWIDSDVPDSALVGPRNGTDWFLKGTTRGMFLEHAEARPFYLRAFDAADFTFILSGEAPINLKGVRTDGTTINQTFHTPPRAIFTPPFFETITLPPLWSERPLNRLEIGVGDNGYALDNIQLEVVPEPRSMQLGAAALAVLLAVAQRARLGCNRLCH